MRVNSRRCEFVRISRRCRFSREIVMHARLEVQGGKYGLFTTTPSCIQQDAWPVRDVIALRVYLAAAATAAASASCESVRRLIIIIIVAGIVVLQSLINRSRCLLPRARCTSLISQRPFLPSFHLPWFAVHRYRFQRVAGKKSKQRLRGKSVNRTSLRI